MINIFEPRSGSYNRLILLCQLQIQNIFQSTQIHGCESLRRGSKISDMKNIKNIQVFKNITKKWEAAGCPFHCIYLFILNYVSWVGYINTF